MFGILTGATRRQGGTQSRRIGRGLFSPKQGNKNFYKGYGARSLGKGDSKGHYHLDPKKVPQIMVPDLTNFTLKPYVAYATPKVKIAPFKAPVVDMTQCEVDIRTAVYGRRNVKPKKSAKTSSKSGKAQKASNTASQASTPALEAPASL